MSTGGIKQYELSADELQQLQSIQKELIAEVQRICHKHHIHFNMVGGTMLGAIRHKGYIPWDDDADIGFLRAEYEKFRTVCKAELDPEKYYMQDLRDTPGYRWGYGKLRRKGTEFIRLNQENMPYEQGVCIDLMPFDNVPDNLLKRKIHFAKCFMYRKILWSEVGKNTEENRAIRIIYRLINKIPMNLVIRMYQHFIDQNGHRKTKLVRILTFPTPKGIYGYKREWYTQLTTYPFGELQLPGAKDYQGYLTVKYGNFMELPPLEKRKVHPVSRVRLLGENHGTK
jgi:lipopolysaccharide cholinephosphotransferase